MTEAEKQAKTAWLRRYQDSLRRERVLALEVERLRSEAERVTPLLSGLTGCGNSTNKLPRAVEALIEAQKELERQIEACLAVRREVEQAIERAPNGREQEILRRRYLLGQRIERIAVDMNLEYRWARRLHQRAVGKLTLAGPL